MTLFRKRLETKLKKMTLKDAEDYKFADSFMKKVIAPQALQLVQPHLPRFEREAGAVLLSIDNLGSVDSKFWSEEAILKTEDNLAKHRLEWAIERVLLRVEYWKRDRAAIPLVFHPSLLVFYSATFYLRKDKHPEYPLFDGSEILATADTNKSAECL